MQIIPDDEAIPGEMPDNISSDSVWVFITEAFSNMTGNIIKHQIIVTQDARQRRDASIADYWSTSDGTKKAYVAIECPFFFNNQCPPKQYQLNRRKRSVTEDGRRVPVAIGINDSCKTTDAGWCNGNLLPATTYYVIYRVCNEHNQCSSTLPSAKMRTKNGNFIISNNPHRSSLRFHM
jgi:hypothetical protein